MSKIMLGIGMVLVSAALVAQDSDPTQEQIVEKCAAEGGCAMFTRDAFLEALRQAKQAGIKEGVQLCMRAA
jgi:hypothetical protein